MIFFLLLSISEAVVMPAEDTHIHTCAYMCIYRYTHLNTYVCVGIEQTLIIYFFKCQYNKVNLPKNVL